MLEFWFQFYFATLTNTVALRQKCPNTEIFWSVFSRIWIEYGDLQ